MKTKDHYDWVVLGDHPGALLSGCLVAHLGFSVLILPLTPSVLSQLTHSGQIIDPESNLMLGLGRGSGGYYLLADLLERLGVMTSGTSLFEAGDAILPQVLTPNARVRLAMDDGFFLHELGREIDPALIRSFGVFSALEAYGPAINNFWKKFPSTLVAEEKRSSRFLSGKEDFWTQLARSIKPKNSAGRKELELNKGDLYEALLDLLGGFLFSATSGSANRASALELLHGLILARTAGVFRGGQTALRGFLVSLARRLGAHFPEEIHCRRLFVESGSLVGVQISQKGRLIGARGAVIGCALDHAKDYLYLSGSERSSLKQSPRPFGWKFTLALTVHKEAIPPAMSPHATWIERDVAPVEIEVSDPAEYGHPDDGNVLVFARTTLPFEPEALQVAFQKRVATKLFQLLTRVMPFLEYHVTRVCPDFRDADTHEFEDFSEAYGFVSPEVIPDNLRCHDSEGVGFFSGIDGVFVANNESHPRLGSFGGTVAALEATAAFAKTRNPPMLEKFRQMWDVQSH